MGIMITYGSYVKDDANLGKSINQIEIFDTVVAFLAGAMIIPAVYAFMGTEGMSSGPSLMFVSLPKVFAAMGVAGNIIGTIFLQWYCSLQLQVRYPSWRQLYHVLWMRSIQAEQRPAQSRESSH